MFNKILKTNFNHVFSLVQIASFVFLSFSIFNGLTVTAESQTPDLESNYVPDQVLVKFKDGFRPEIGQQFQQLTIDKKSSEDGVYLLTNKIDNFRSQSLKDYASVSSNVRKQNNSRLDSLINQLKIDPRVESVAPNNIVKAKFTPNDTFYGDQWGLKNTGQQGGQVNLDINAEAAWDITRGNNTIVAVIDSGVNLNHPDLNDNILRNSNGNVIGYDYANNDAVPEDDEGHGTHVAGIIAAEGNNSTGVSGVCPNCKIMPMKFLDQDGFGDTFGAVESMKFAIKNNASVINNSWGGEEQNIFIQDVINQAHSKNIVVVAAAGNDNTSTPMYPASMNHVISVSSITRTGNRALFSNFGSTIDLTAPGEQILSTFPPNTDLGVGCSDNSYSTANDGYGYCSGTSMSSPAIAGCAALIKTVRPSLNGDEVEQLLKNTAKDVGSPGRDDNFGNGIIDCKAAIENPITCPNNQFQVEYFSNLNFTGTPISICEGRQIDRDWGDGRPHPSIHLDSFSIRYNGMFNFNAGEYKFKVRADENVKVWVNNVMIIDNTNINFYKAYSKKVNLASGMHNIRIEYKDFTNYALLKFSY
jgi:thermitase